MAQTSLGTPYFLPPEMCRGETYNNKADIWMLGCLLYELCSLKKPFLADNIVRLMNLIVTEPIPEIPKEYSDDLRTIVKLLTNKDDTKRPFIREILETEIVLSKMKKYNIIEIESPTNKNRMNCSNDISLKTNNENDNNSIIMQSTSMGSLLVDNNNKINMKGNVSISKNGSQPNLVINKNNSNNKSIMEDSLINNNESDNIKMRKKLRVPDKINKKYESMGAQAIDKVMNEMNLNNNEVNNINNK